MNKLEKPTNEKLESTTSYVNLIKNIVLIIAGLLTIASTVYAAVIGNLWIAGILFAIGILIFCSYIRFAKQKSVSQLVEAGNELPAKFIFSPKARTRSGWVIILATVFIFVISIGFYVIKVIPSDNVIVLVADFEHPQQPEQENYKVTAEIVKKLRERTKNYPNIEIRTLNEHLSYKIGKEEIRKKGYENKAAIVIWGDVAKTEQTGRISVNVEILKKPQKLTLLNNKLVSYIPSTELDTYTAQIDLSNQLSFFTLVVDGLAQTEAGNDDDAIARYTTALNQSDPSNKFINLADVYYFRGSLLTMKSIYWQANELSSAISDLTEAIKLKDGFSEAYVLRGFCFLQRGRRSLALRDIEEAVKLEPSSAINLYLQGQAYYLRQEYDLAEQSLKRVTEIEPQEASDYFLRGTVHMFLGNGVQSEQDFENAKNLDSRIENESLLLTALARLEQNKTIEAKSILDRLIKEKPDFNFAKVMRAMLIADEKPKQLITEMNSIIEKAPNLDQLYLLRGAAFADLDKYDEALKDFNKAVSLNSHSSKNYFTRAHLYKEKESWKQSLSDFDKALELDPENPEYYLERGIILKTTEEYELAIKDLKKSISFYPQYKDAYIALSDIYAEQHKYGKGEITVSKVNLIFPQSPIDRKYLIGISYLSRAKTRLDVKPEEALSDVSKTLELLPNFVPALDVQNDIFLVKDAKIQIQLKKIATETSDLKSKIKQIEESLSTFNESLKKLSEKLINEGKTVEILRKELVIKNETITLLNESNHLYRKSIELQKKQNKLLGAREKLLLSIKSNSEKQIAFHEKELNELKSNVSFIVRLPSLPLETDAVKTP